MRFIFTLLAVGFLVVLVIGGAFVWDSYIQVPSEDAELKRITVNQGETVKDIAATLLEENIIESQFFFETYVWYTNTETEFQAGVFELRSGMNYSDIARIMKEGVFEDLQVTIPEGYNLRQIGEAFVGVKLVTLDEWFAVVGDPAVDYRASASAKRPKDFSSLFSFLESKPEHISLEGYLFPDTYRFFPDTSAEEIVVKMLTNFNNKLTPQMRTDAENRGRSIHQIVTMASIIEREVQSENDMALVSDLFWRRLGLGMALQADSTVNYITGKATPAISFKDRDILSSWNTYKYAGLPPSPISSPGLNALTAAVYPKSNTAIYFLTDSEGNVHYGNTLEEHNVNKANYLK